MAKTSDFRIDFSGRGHKYSEAEKRAVLEVMEDSSTLTQGKHRDEFERKFSKYLGVEHSFAVNTATSGLELAAQLCRIQSGDEIICPAHTFTSSVYPFLKKGAKPVWADIDLETRVITTETISPLITDRTKAIIVVHLYGYAADMPAIMNLASAHGLIVIEDNAQALGAEIEGRKAGSFGDIGITSFHSHKNMTTLGEGGMISVRDPQMADVLPMLRHNGHCGFDFEREDYWIPAMGNLDLPHYGGDYLWPNNYCLGEAECALGTVLLDRLDSMNEERRQRAIRFIDAFEDFPEVKFHREDSLRHVYHQLIPYFASGIRDAFIRKMAIEKRIKCIVPYYPLNRYPLYQRLGFGSAHVPNTDDFFQNMASLPFHHWMSDEDFDYMLQSTRDTLMELRA